jgi:hypothetical protein
MPVTHPEAVQWPTARFISLVSSRFLCMYNCIVLAAVSMGGMLAVEGKGINEQETECCQWP